MLQILQFKFLSQVSGSFIKCNAIEILFVTSSVQYTCVLKDKNKIYIQKCYETITDLLKNFHPEVCIVTINVSQFCVIIALIFCLKICRIIIK